MEIITIVLDGEVTHEDSLGTKAVMRAGDVQRMSAGTGIRHSEFNLGEVPAHFYQIWIYPDTSGLPPSYDQKSFAGTVWTNRLVPVASGQGLPDVVTFHTDATLYLGSLEAQRSVTHASNGTRRVFVYLTEGELAVDGAGLSTTDHDHRVGGCGQRPRTGAGLHRQHDGQCCLSGVRGGGRSRILRRSRGSVLSRVCGRRHARRTPGRRDGRRCPPPLAPHRRCRRSRAVLCRRVGRHRI